MNTLIYQVEFLDYWNTSSGLSGGALADTLCLKDENGLPFLPGKTIKGLFREAAETLGALQHEGFSEDFIVHVFGEEERRENAPEQSEPTAIATSFFSNATLDSQTATAIIKKGLCHFLFEEISSTALDAGGIAKDYTLRRTQYALPCTLYGEILEAAGYENQLADCARFIKRLGLNRHRGYGRCKITIL